MKISVLQENLQKALSAAVRVVDTRPTLPVLANVLLATEDSRLRISATNLEISVTTWIGAKIEEPGAITLPAKTLQELVNNLSPERVDMTLDTATQTVNVRCGAATSNIKGIDADEFPMVPVSGEPDLSMNAGVFKEMVKHTEFAAAKDESRPILTGIYTEIEGNQLRAAPNPFNPLTVLTFDLTRGGEASVSIYNARGQLVDRLDLGARSAGHHEVTWRARDHGGRTLPSATYFGVLERDGRQIGEVVKLSLVR